MEYLPKLIQSMHPDLRLMRWNETIDYVLGKENNCCEGLRKASPLTWAQLNTHA